MKRQHGNHTLMTLLMVLVIVANTNSQSLVPEVSAGTIKRFESFVSKYVDSRNIDVWLPRGYDPGQKYAVLYMHDGQMLYDSAIAWNKQSWEVDRIADQLQSQNKTKKFIVVGIWNNGAKRHPEYFPQKPLESLSQKQRDDFYQTVADLTKSKEIVKVQSDNYLLFLVKELKPFIDKNFSTLKDRQNTFIAGSSMGGLISMYAICEYPKVFGGAACLSTHWPGTFSVENNPIPDAFLNYLKTHLPSPKTHRLYFDFGTETLDALYEPFQRKADEIIRQGGYNSENWMTKKFDGANHSELAWQKRLNIPLVFLLQK